MKVIYYWTQRPINTNRTSSGYWRKYKYSEDLPKKKKRAILISMLKTLSRHIPMPILFLL